MTARTAARTSDARPERHLAALFLVAAAVVWCATSARASESWPNIRAEAFGARAIHDGRAFMALKAPYRPDDVRSVPLHVEAKLGDGRTIKAVSFIVDENPMPVAAAFRLGEGRSSVRLTAPIRLNQQSDVRVVLEASDGELYMVEQLVKFAGGQASCSAPPVGDPAEIAANMGRMEFASTGARPTASGQLAGARYALNHPNHTGMVLDPVTLYYIPLKMVQTVEARQGDDLVFTLTGSITLAQNPAIEFDYLTNGATAMTFTVVDTDNGRWQRDFPVGPAS